MVCIFYGTPPFSADFWTFFHRQNLEHTLIQHKIQHPAELDNLRVFWIELSGDDGSEMSTTVFPYMTDRALVPQFAIWRLTRSELLKLSCSEAPCLRHLGIKPHLKSHKGWHCVAGFTV